MKSVDYQLRIKGLATPDGTISVKALTELLRGLTESAERGLRLAVEGASVKSGRTPGWLEKAVGFNVTGLERGSTVLKIEAPTLGDAIGPELQQQDFWVAPPAREDTALSLFARSVTDTTAENLESDYHDAGVLRSLLGFRPFLKTMAQSLELTAPGRPGESVTLSMAEMEKTERLKVRTPDPRAFIVSGHLDAIQHSRRRFQLVLPDTQVIRGRVDEEFIGTEDLRQFWGLEVTVRGTVHFRPSGRVQLLEAQSIKASESGEEVFAEMPQAQSEAEFVAEALRAAPRKDWLQEVWDKWPGDESVEEILQQLKR